MVSAVSIATPVRRIRGRAVALCRGGLCGGGHIRLAHAAGLTRGALHHQFPDKAGLFAVVAEAVEADLQRRTTLEVRPLARVLLGALQEVAFAIAAEPEQREGAAEALHAILSGLHQS
jgi:AcrR family transcriptional regulator